MSSPQPDRDDSLMDRFGLRRPRRARDAVFVVLLTAVLLLISQGASVRKAGEEATPGVGRDVLLAVGRPAGWISDRLPLAGATHDATNWVSPDENLSGPGGFIADTLTTGPGAIPSVTPDAFTDATLGQPAAPRRPLKTVLVTGDSMSEPLDSDLAQLLIPKGVKVVQDPHIGTGISTTFILNWGSLAVSQVKQYHPDAVVVFIGANDGFPMADANGRQVNCCGAAWAAIYANRVRQMANTYRQAGAAHVYWLTLPTPREAARQSIARVVNAAITVAAQPWADQVQLVDTVPIFTPGDVYRDAMPINGQQTIVRQADGIHLNDAGSSLLAGIVLGDINANFTY